MKNRNLNNHDNWKTPDWLYNQLNEEFNFDFDPCPLHFGPISPDKDGLLIEWGDCNFVNPPYSRKLKESFIRRAAKEARKGKVCVLLIPSSTSTEVFHDVILKYAKEIRFIKGRVQFDGINTKGEVADGNPMHDSMIVVFDGYHVNSDVVYVRIENKTEPQLKMEYAQSI